MRVSVCVQTQMLALYKLYVCFTLAPPADHPTDLHDGIQSVHSRSSSGRSRHALLQASIHLSVCLYVYLCASLCVCVSVCLFQCMQNICVSLGLFAFICVCLWLFVSGASVR